MNQVETIDTYCAAWNEIDGGRRAKILAAALAPDATYTDPTVHTVGIPQLVAHIDAVFARYPGSRIVRTSEVGFASWVRAVRMEKDPCGRHVASRGHRHR
jgi:hypothetical protein